MKTKKVNKLNVKKIIFYLSLLFLGLIISYFVVLYYEIINDKEKHFDAAQQFILQETTINNITAIDYFQGENGYFIMHGHDERTNQAVDIYLLDEKPFQKDYVKIFAANRFISLEEITYTWQHTCKGCELRKITPAMIDEIPLWEITYIDEEQRYVIEYRTKTDGETVEQLRFTRN